MRKDTSLDYLNNKPKIISWRHLIGPELEYCQMHDVVFDEYDYRIRQLSYQEVRRGNKV